MGRFGRVGAAIGTTTVVLGTSWLFISVLQGRTRSWMHVDAAIVAWLVFGAALGAAVRWLPRRVAGAAAVLLAAVGVADLFLRPIGPVAWIATSEYVWIALAALGIKAATEETASTSATLDDPPPGTPASGAASTFTSAGGSEDRRVEDRRS